MGKVNWSTYKDEILALSRLRIGSTKILDILTESHGNIFTRSSDRDIRRIIQTHNKGISKNTYAKVLIFDIETAPMECYVFSRFQKFISDKMIKRDWFMLCWSAKYLFDDKIYNSKLTQKELLNDDDSRIAKNLWNLINDADVIIAHNAIKFDVKKMNTRFILHGMQKPSPYQVIDTLLHARRQFSISSNALWFLAEKFFNVEGKMSTEAGLWTKCMEGHYPSLEYMQKYCDQDVMALESVYLAMRGWISPHPNMALMAVSDQDCCPVCSCTDRETCDTPYRTYVNEYDAFRCTNCGHIYRSRRTNTPIKGNKGLKVSIPK